MMTLGATFISRVPMAALAGVTAWMGLRLLDWSAWKRLPKMRRVDAAAFLATATGVLVADAVRAIVIGCSFYIIRYIYQWLTGKLEQETLAKSASVQAP